MSEQIIATNQAILEMIAQGLDPDIIDLVRQPKNALNRLYVDLGGQNWNGNA